jgi:hypothetical protein
MCFLKYNGVPYVFDITNMYQYSVIIKCINVVYIVCDGGAMQEIWYVHAPPTALHVWGRLNNIQWGHPGWPPRHCPHTALQIQCMLSNMQGGHPGWPYRHCPLQHCRFNLCWAICTGVIVDDPLDIAPYSTAHLTHIGQYARETSWMTPSTLPPTALHIWRIVDNMQGGHPGWPPRHCPLQHRDFNIYWRIYKGIIMEYPLAVAPMQLCTFDLYWAICKGDILDDPLDIAP